MTSRSKKKRQQRAQSLQALARERQRQREHRQQTLALRAEKRWSNTLHQLDALGASVKTFQKTIDGIEKTLYEVTYQGQVHQFPTRSRLQRWFKPKRKRQEEEQMSWAERHVQWMIDNNCDDHGNPFHESDVHWDKNCSGICLKRLVRPKEPMNANRPCGPFHTVS